MSGKADYKSKKGNKETSGYSKKKGISRKRPLNRFEMESPQENVSTSFKKVKSPEDIDVDPVFGYRILNFTAVFSAISQVVKCKTCNKDVKFSESTKRGLGFKIIVSCGNCTETTIPNSSFINKAYEINRRIILAMRLLGIGLNGIEKFCAFMELPRPIFHSFYDKVVQTICVVTTAVAINSMKNAVETEKTESEKKNSTSHLTVSGDGSWRKRGFTSLFGVSTLIGWFSGKVVDMIVKSKYCKSCEFWGKKIDTEEYAEWKKQHDEECQINHEGSAGKMEVEAMVEMFRRSTTLYNIKYQHYIGDGDSKTFKGILDAKPYDDIDVEKKECIDHVQKRLGTRLRNIKKQTKGLGGKGKLTGKLIDELSIYYGLAIRRHHESVEKMREAIWATLHHKMSTDENPQHDNCPPGEDSWCSWQKAKATGALDEYVHKSPMSEIVFSAVKPVYEELTSDNLLTRCIGGFTQNSNESLNAVVWSMAPKTVSSGKNILDIAANMAVCVYNDGLSSIMQVMKALDMTIGENCYNFCLEADARRIQFSERSMSEAAKKARLSLKSSRKEEDEENINIEGQLYGAGIAD